MRSLFVPRVAAAALFFSLLLLAAASARAQIVDIEGGAKRIDLGGGAGTIRSGPRARPRNPTTRNANTVVRTVTVTKTIKVTPTTGTLSVNAEPGATILVEPDSGGEAKKGTVPAGERFFIFVDLKPGRYRVAASLDDEHKDAEERVTIKPNQTVGVTLELPPITYTVTINTNVASGEIRYAPVEGKPDPATGETKYNPVGKTSIAPIQNGKAVLTDLLPGTYGVDIRTTETGYQTLLSKFTLPGETTYTVALKKKLSEEQLLANWDVFKSKWEAPAGWSVNSESTSLQVRGRGIAIHRDEKYRYYADFELQSDIKLRNKAGVSFAIHARDPQNYYLIQLTGAEADEPYVLRGFIIRNGVRQSFGEPQSIRPFTSTLTSSQPFTVKMKMQGKNLSVFLTDNATGKTQPAGVLTDSNAEFPIGAVGMAAADREEYDVLSFLICPNDCTRRR